MLLIEIEMLGPHEQAPQNKAQEVVYLNDIKVMPELHRIGDGDPSGDIYDAPV